MAKLFFSLYFIVLVVIYMLQSKIPEKVVAFVVFKLPFKMDKYFVIIVIINLIFGSVSLKGHDNYIMKQRTWNEIINLNR